MCLGGLTTASLSSLVNDHSSSASLVVKPAQIDSMAHLIFSQNEINNGATMNLKPSQSRKLIYRLIGF